MFLQTPISASASREPQLKEWASTYAGYTGDLPNDKVAPTLGYVEGKGLMSACVPFWPHPHVTPHCCTHTPMSCSELGGILNPVSLEGGFLVLG